MIWWIDNIYHLIKRFHNVSVVEKNLKISISARDHSKAEEYGNTGCGVFKWGYKIRKIFAYKSTYSKEIIEF